jgi:hypothetical protein
LAPESPKLFSAASSDSNFAESALASDELAATSASSAEIRAVDSASLRSAVFCDSSAFKFAEAKSFFAWLSSTATAWAWAPASPESLSAASSAATLRFRDSISEERFASSFWRAAIRTAAAVLSASAFLERDARAATDCASVAVLLETRVSISACLAASSAFVAATFFWEFASSSLAASRACRVSAASASWDTDPALLIAASSAASFPDKDALSAERRASSSLREEIFAAA